MNVGGQDASRSSELSRAVRNRQRHVGIRSTARKPAVHAAIGIASAVLAGQAGVQESLPAIEVQRGRASVRPVARPPAAGSPSRRVPALHPIARYELRYAAEGDEAEDLFVYGQELIRGRGGPAHLAEAAIWLGRAEAKGFPGALALLAQAREQQAFLQQAFVLY